MRAVARPATPWLRPVATGIATLTWLSCAFASGPADPAAATSHARLEEIIVTARRREEPLLSVPIAMTVLSEQELRRRQIESIHDLQHAAPSLVIVTDQTNRATSVIAMRGHLEGDAVPTVDPTVGIYLDGVYIARSTGANLRLLDLERIEVLRGPQGTLFGRNTIGGAISLVSRSPSPWKEGRAEATVGNYDRRELTAMLNLPFEGGRHALRVAASHTEHDGYARSTLLGEDLNDEDTDFVRAGLRLTPFERWSVVLSADHTRMRDGGQLRTLAAAGPGSAGITGAAGRPDDDIRHYIGRYDRQVMANRAGSVTTEVQGAAATVTMDAPGWRLKSITGVRSVESRARDGDQDASPYDLGAVVSRDDHQDQFSQELQASGVATRGRLDWTAGLLYFEEEARFDQRFLAFIPATGRLNENLPRARVDNESVAGYAQLGYAPVPRLRITAGLRLNEDRRQLTTFNARRVAAVEVCRLDPALLDSPGICRATLPERRFDYAPFLLGVDFRPDDRSLLYAKLSQGHRAGGYNLRGATNVDLGTFAPESAAVVEIGGRAAFLDDRLQLDLALFRTRYEDIQLVQRPELESDSLALRFIANGGEARIHGGELGVAGMLGPVRLAGSLGVVDAEFTRLSPAVVDVDLESDFLNTPRTTVSLAGDWSAPTRFGRVDLHVDYAWRDEVPFDYDPRSVARQPAYSLWNARAAIALGGGLELAVWARNLADTRYLTRALDAGHYVSASVGDPRTYGLTLACHFGRSRAASKPAAIASTAE